MTSTIASSFHSDYSENTLVEGNAIALFADLGWETVNGFHESYGEGGTLGREHKGGSC